VPSLPIDLRLAVRGLCKAPGLFAVAVASLALGIGANVTVYSVVREMILDEVSARRPDRLAAVEGIDASYLRYRQLQSSGVFQELAFHRGLGDRVWQRESRGEMAWTLTTSANFFETLGVSPFAGRLYGKADEGHEVAVVSFSFWQKRLGGGFARPLRLNGRLFEVVGVLPRDYRSVYGHGLSPEVYLSDRGNADARDHGCRLFGRMRDGASREQTRQALAAATGDTVSLRRMGGIEGPFYLFFAMLFGVAAILGLIACSNVAGLLLARAIDRRRDLEIRRALGANRFQLVRPLLAEAVLLILCGAAAALSLDAVLRQRLSYVRWPNAYGVPFEFYFRGADHRFLLGALVAVFCGLAPALFFRRVKLRAAFVMAQVALTMLLLTLGAIFTRSFVHLAHKNPGFDVAHTLIATVHPLPGQPMPDVVARVETVPGVVSATSAGILPFMGELPEAPLRRPGGPIQRAYVVGAGERYCATLGIPILRGRDFERPDRTRRPTPAIVNQTLAGQVFGEQEVVGQRLLIGEEAVEIVAVAADADMRTLGEGHLPVLFRPEFNAQLLVRVAGDPSQWVEPLRSVLQREEAAAAIDVRPMQIAAEGAMFPMRVAAGFVGSLSGIGLVLALTGLYASVSHAVSARTRDFGIRSALGASRRRIVWTAVRGSAAVLGCGAALGILLSIAAIRPITGLLPDGTDPWSPASFVVVGVLLLSTGAAAAWAPARRAAEVDPCAALRHD